MDVRGFGKFATGFFFIMFNFKIGGFDITPDVIGYLFFAAGFSALAKSSIYFEKGGRFNIPMTLLSLVHIYDPPAQQGQFVNLGLLGFWGIPVSIVTIVLSLVVVYYLFMGIKDLAARYEKPEILEEADRRWRQYLALTLAAIPMMALIFIPILAFACIIVLFFISIGLMIAIRKFMRICGESFLDIDTE